MLTMTMLIACVPIITHAETSGTCGDNLTWTLDDEGTLTIRGTGETDDYKASGVDDIINSPWFPVRGQIKSVVIEEGVTGIGWYAFKHCTEFTKITIPKSLKSVDWSAFDNCQGLKDVYISDLAAWCGINFYDSYSNPMRYADNLYVNDELITDLVIPEEVTEIGGKAFSHCANLRSVTITENVKKIGNGAFSDCNGLSDIIIPGNVESIGSEAFFQCMNLKNITLSDGIKEMGADVFFSCRALENVYITDLTAYLNIQMDSNPVYYAENLYLNGEKITGDLIIPDDAMQIPKFAFRGCDITSVTIPDSVKRICRGAFSGCSDMTSVTLGNGITYIDEYTFSDCDSLTDVYYGGIKEQWNAITVRAYNDKLQNVNMHYAEVVRTDTRDDTEYKFKVELVNSHENCYVYTAVYDEAGLLLGVERVMLKTEGSTDVSIEKAENAKTAKVFVWTEELQPIMEAVSQFEL